MSAKSPHHAEIARGLLLVSVFHAHLLYGLAEGAKAPWAQLELKVIAPAVALYFILSGMSAQGLLNRRFSAVLAQSLFLQLLAIISHVLGFVLLASAAGHWPSPREFVVELLKPIVYGTGYSTYVAWFFTVLAATRLIVYGLGRRRLLTLALLAVFALGLYAAKLLRRPDNLYEWRNLPASVLAFYVGMLTPVTWHVPYWLGAGALGAAILIALVNTPSLPRTGPCLNCEPEFVAQPMVGEYGFIPAYAAYLLLTFCFIQWFCRWVAPTPIGNAFKFFGRASLQILLLHGWVLLTIYALFVRYLPKWDSPWFHLPLLCANMALHAALYALLRRPLNRLVRFTSSLSRRLAAALAALPERLAHFGR